MSGKIYAPNITTSIGSDPNDSTNKYKDITGEDKGTKRGMHTISLGGTGDFNSLVYLALIGSQPAANYDSIVVNSVSDSEIRYDFYLNSSVVFVATITNADTAFPTIAITTNNFIILEQSSTDVLLLESGDILLKESA